MKTFQVQNPLTFLESFNRQAKNAKERLWLQCMSFEPGKYVDVFVETMIEAAGRGVDVRVSADWISDVFYEGRFDFSPVLNLPRIPAVRAFNQKRHAMYSRLRDAGVKVTITNTPNFFASLLPVFGRNHTKMFLIDSDVAWIGGVNLMDSGFENADLMVETTDPKVISALAAHFPKVNKLRPAHDYAVNCGPNEELLFDSGRFRKSIIHASTLELIRGAQKKIVFVSQMVPDFAVLDLLIKASEERGVEVTVVTSNRDDELFVALPYKVLYDRYISKTKGNPRFSLVHIHKKLHIKLMIADDQRAIFGSHNFSQLGGLFGTEEIAMVTSSQELVSDFRKHLSTELNVENA